jgi:tetratricopeptide (TPR) repeat protein
MYKRIFPQLLLTSVSLLLLVTPTFSQAGSPGAQSVSRGPETLPELVKRVKPTVVAIATYDSQGEALMTGSGFFLRPGQVVTNLHVIRGASRSEIKTLDGKGRVFRVAGTLAVDEEGDLALLSVEMPFDSSWRPRSSELARALPDEGEQIVVIGNPLKLEGSVTDGIVSAVREVPNVGKIIQITAPISHGNSGSPVFNMKGQVVGVVTIKVTNGQNINLAIGAGRVEQLRAGQLRSLSALPAKERVSDLGESSYRIGLDSLWLGNYDNAIGYFETTANRNPRRADAWVQVGYCKVKQGKNDEAIHAYQHALELKPNSEEIHNKLGDAYYYAGRMRDAIASYSRAASIRPDNADAHYNLAVAYFESGNERLALTEAKTLRQLDAKLYEKLMSETRIEQ